MKKCFLSAAAAVLMLVTALAGAEVMAINTETSALLADTNGDVLLDAGTYSAIIDIGEINGRKFFAGVSGDGYALIDETGKCVNDTAYEYLYTDAGVMFFGVNGKLGVFDENCSVSVQPDYTALVPDGQGGYIGIKSDIYDDEPDGLYHVGCDGSETVTGVKLMGSLIGFSEGLMPAVSTDNGKYGYLDAEGEWYIKPQYEYAGDFRNGRAVCWMDSGTGIIDKEGSWLVTPKYDLIEYDGSLMYALKYGSGVTVFGTDDLNEIYSVGGKDVYAALTDGYVFLMDNEETCIVNGSGEKVIEAGPDATMQGDPLGNITVSDGDWGDKCVTLHDAGGNVLAGPYQLLYFVGEYDGKGYYCFGSFDPDGMASGEEGLVRYGLIDDNGSEILGCEYDVIESVVRGYITAVNGEQALIYSLSDGKTVIIN